LEREQYYIDLLKQKYNILKTAGSSLGFKHSEETWNKMSTAHGGKILSKETKAKIAAAHLGKAKIERVGKPSQRILVIDILRNESQEFESISAVANHLDIRHSTISKYLINNQKNLIKSDTFFKKYNFLVSSRKCYLE
jgi:group I intron endonuclease